LVTFNITLWSTEEKDRHVRKMGVVIK